MAGHTISNIPLGGGEFVVNFVSDDLTGKMNASAAMLGRDESEFAAFGIEATASTLVKPPRVAAARAALECVLDRVILIGEGPGASNVIFGRIQTGHVSDAILDAAGRIDPLKFDVIARLGGDSYCRTRDVFQVSRPD